MKRNLVILTVLALLLGAYWIWNSSLTPNAMQLAQTASSGADSNVRVKAAVELSMLKEADSLSQLRQLLQTSKDPEVLIQAISTRLNARQDHDSLPLFYAALDHPSRSVQQEALAVVLRASMAAPCPVNSTTRSMRPADERAPYRFGELRETHEKGLANRPNMNAFAKGPPPPDVVSNPAPSPSTAPSPSPSPAPIRASAPTSDFVNSQTFYYDIHAIFIVAWVCRASALLVLAIVMIGAGSVLVDQSSQLWRAKKADAPAAPLSAEERFDRLLAKNSPSLWSKVAMLVVGVVVIVALLVTGEMVGVAVSIDQKIARDR